MTKELLAVALGGAFGRILRYGFSVCAAALSLSGLYATMAANVCGSFLIGLFMAVCSQGTPIYLLTTVGLCGGFTTFSTFSAQTLQLLQAGEWLAGLGYALLSVCCCVVCVVMGQWTGRLFT